MPRARQTSQPPPESSRASGAQIRRLTIGGFKSLRDVDVELGQINVFIGPNGAGKSNLLEAIGLLGAAAGGRVDDQALLRRGVRPGVPALYKSAFKGQSVPPKISLQAHAVTGASYHAYITNPISNPKPFWIFGNETLLDASGDKVASRGPRGDARVGRQRLKLENHGSVAALARADQDTPVEIRNFLESLADYAIFSPVTPVLRGIAPDTAPRAPVGLFGGQLAEAVGLMMATRAGKQELAEVYELIDWAEDVTIGEPSAQFLSPSVPTMRHVLRFRDRHLLRPRSTLSAYDASEGALYVLFMLILAAHGQSPRSFAIDNFDQSLNPRTARALTRIFVDKVLKHERQAFLTTHNPLVLDGLPLDDDRVRLFAVERARRSGATVVRRITVDLARAEKKLGDAPLSRLWVMGRLGGVPNV
jgi:energy-coupling factor transporter ATP-binding protein EcfA2